MSELQELLSTRPRWLQAAALELARVGALDAVGLESLLAKCKAEAVDQELVETPDLTGLSIGRPVIQSLRLRSIASICGINKLSPREPLTFGENPLTVVYGLNGSGKSGYVRILKHVCGARDPGVLKPDVSQPQESEQACTVTYSVDDEEKSCRWNPAMGPVADLTAVDVFDTREGVVFVTAENEVTYEPRVLSFLTDLIGVVERVRTILSIEIDALPSGLPEMSDVFSTTSSGRWFAQITSGTSDEEIDRSTRWDREDEVRLDTLRALTAGESPVERAQAIKRKIGQLEGLESIFDNLGRTLSDAECSRLRDLSRRAWVLRAAADIAATEAFSDAPLSGIGSETWKQLWDHARAYSTTVAYPGLAFPNTQEGSRCVLCHEPLSSESKDRLESFEGFVRSRAEAEALAAESTVDEEIDLIDPPPAEDVLGLLLDAAGIESGEDRTALLEAAAVFAARLEWTTTVASAEPLQPIRSLSDWSNRLSEQLSALEESHQSFLKESERRLEESSTVNSDILELEARKWVSENTEAVRSERDRLITVVILERARSLAATTGLSAKKSELAQRLVSDAFAARFTSELKKLGARSLPVELRRTRTERGHTLHRLQYYGIEGPVIADVLSEGEFRIVSLAACLADGAANHHNGPFVFDDPISSLDQLYEEAVAQRLVELSVDRQVIVFTHRLSLLALLQDCAKRKDAAYDVVAVVAEHWGTGDPGEVPFQVKRPARAINALVNDRIPRARKTLEERGTAEYAPEAKAICSDFRILLERIVELHLLNGVVERYRRSVQTDGRIKKLALVTPEDCEFFDSLMTKFSRYEHSQATESPVELPRPDELAADAADLGNWLGEYEKRVA